MDTSTTEASDKLHATVNLNHQDCVSRIQIFDAKFEGQLKSVDIAAAEVDRRIDICYIICNCRNHRDYSP